MGRTETSIVLEALNTEELRKGIIITDDTERDDNPEGTLCAMTREGKPMVVNFSVLKEDNLVMNVLQIIVKGEPTVNLIACGRNQNLHASSPKRGTIRGPEVEALLVRRIRDLQSAIPDPIEAEHILKRRNSQPTERHFRFMD